MSPRVVIEEEQPSRVRVTRSDGTRVELDGPIITSDSIADEYGGCVRYVKRWGRSVCEESRVVSVALSDVQAVEVGRTDTARSVGAAALGAGLLFLGVWIYAFNTAFF